ncbi:MAG: tetratricopeptide repeat protein [bacterium]
MKNSCYIFIFLLNLAACGLFSAPLLAQHEDDKDKGKKDAMISNPSALIEIKKMIFSGRKNDAEGLLSKYIERYPQDPVGFFELSKLLASRKAYPEALTYAEKANQLDQTNIWVQLFLAETYQMNQDYDKALAIFEQIVASNPDNLDYYYQLAALYLGLGKYQQAIKMYDKIESRIGISEEISLQKQKIYLHLKEHSKSEAELKRLIESNPGESRYYGILAEFYMSEGKQEQALEQYEKILEMDPGNAYIHMTLADYYRKAGDREKAYEELRLGFANPNLDVDTKINILLSFYSINEIVSDLKTQAFALADILIETHPDDPKVYSIQGDLFSQDQQYKEARDAFLKVLALDSSRYVVWEELLRMDLLTNDYEHLRKYGYRASELYPEQPVINLLTAVAELQLKHYPEAEKLLNRGVKMVVNNNELLAQFYMYLGDTYHALDNAAESDKAYEKSLQIREDNPYVLNNYSYYLSLRGEELGKAEQMAKKAIAIEPDNSSFQDTYGWVLFKLGRYEEAKEWIGKSLEDRENTSGEVLEHYGDVLFKLGDIDNAVTYWKQAREKGDGSAKLNDKIAQKKIPEE